VSRALPAALDSLPTVGRRRIGYFDKHAHTTSSNVTRLAQHLTHDMYMAGYWYAKGIMMGETEAAAISETRLRVKERTGYEALLTGVGSRRERALAAAECSDKQLYSLLVRQQREIAAQMRRADARLRSQKLWGLGVQLVAAWACLLGSLVLVVWPYLGDLTGPNRLVVPDIITIVSAFVVALFAYFVFALYREFAAGHRMQVEARFILNDGMRALEETQRTLQDLNVALHDDGKQNE
jgi:hypothetical protein